MSGMSVGNYLVQWESYVFPLSSLETLCPHFYKNLARTKQTARAVKNTIMSGKRNQDKEEIEEENKEEVQEEKKAVEVSGILIFI